MVRAHQHVFVVARWELIVKMNKKTKKIKIDKFELEQFPYDQLVIDPYWDDLYNPIVKPKIRITNEKYYQKY